LVVVAATIVPTSNRRSGKVRKAFPSRKTKFSGGEEFVATAFRGSRPRSKKMSHSSACGIGDNLKAPARARASESGKPHVLPGSAKGSDYLVVISSPEIVQELFLKAVQLKVKSSFKSIK